MKKILTLVMCLSLWIGAFANHEKATLIIKVSDGDLLEVKVNGNTFEKIGQQFVIDDLVSGNQQVIVHKIVSSGYNQPTTKKLLYKGDVKVTEGLITTYLLDKNVMRFQEEKAVVVNNGKQLNNGNNVDNSAHYSGYYHSQNHPGQQAHPNHPNPPSCGNPPPHHCNSGCNHGNGYNGWSGYNNNFCPHYNQYGHCNNSGCQFAGCQVPHNAGTNCGTTNYGYQNYGYNNGYGNGYWSYDNSYYNGYYNQNYNGYGNQNYNGYSNNNGYNNQGNNGYQNNPSNPNNYYGNKQPMSPQNFKVFMDQLQDKYMDADKVQLAKSKLENEVVSVAQVKSVLSEIYFENNKLEVAKFLHKRTVDQQNYHQLNDAFTYTSSKNYLAEFIKNEVK